MSGHASVTSYISAVLATVPVAANWWEPLVASGPIGIVLLWFMFRSEKRTEELVKAINNQVLMMTDVILALKHGDETIKELAAKCREQAASLSKYENSSGRR